MVIDQDAMTDRELAWSQTEYGDVPVLLHPDPYDEEAPCWSMRLNLLEPAKDLPPRRRRRVRVSQVLIGLCAAVAMTAIGGVVITLTAIERREAPTVPSVAPAADAAPVPAAQCAGAELLVPPPPSAVPAPTAEVVPTSIEPPPPPPPATPHPPAPRVMTTPKPPPPPVATTTQPPPEQATSTPTSTPPPAPAQTSTSTPVPMTTQWIHVPLLPVPIPVPVPASQAPQAPQNPQYQPARRESLRPGQPLDARRL